MYMYLGFLCYAYQELHNKNIYKKINIICIYCLHLFNSVCDG